MEKKHGPDYTPSRGVLRACSGIIESVDSSPYSEYMLLAESAVGRDWAPAARAQLIEAIKLNLINRKEYSFDRLQRRYRLPCCQKTFSRECRLYVRILSGLCGFE